MKRADLTEKYQRKIAAKGAEKLNHKNAAYAAMTESMDTAIGRVRQKLADLGLTEKTIVVFTSDNGACYEWGPFGFDGRSRAGRSSSLSCAVGISWPRCSTWRCR